MSLLTCACIQVLVNGPGSCVPVCIAAFVLKVCSLKRVRARTQALAHARAHAHAHTRTHAHAHTRTHTHTCTCTYTNMHTHAYAHTFSLFLPLRPSSWLCARVSAWPFGCCLGTSSQVLGLSNCTIVYVESVCRVHTLSLSAKILQWFAGKGQPVCMYVRAVCVCCAVVLSLSHTHTRTDIHTHTQTYAHPQFMSFHDFVASDSCVVRWQELESIKCTCV